MCQLALDMFGRTLNERHIAFSFRYENYARLFHKKCSLCQAPPYLPVAGDLTIHGLSWQLETPLVPSTVAANFQPICIRCAVMQGTNIGFWIPTVLSSDDLAYILCDGKTLATGRVAFTSHPQVYTSEPESVL